jgi:hypothetical protein
MFNQNQMIDKILKARIYQTGTSLRLEYKAQLNQ